MHRHEPGDARLLEQLLDAPSLYDEFLRYLARRGMPVPRRARRARLVAALRAPPRRRRGVQDHLREHPSSYWDAYDMCEKLVDVEENFQLWRFRHMKTVERIIGFKRGTGGTAGVSFLRKTLELALFPGADRRAHGDRRDDDSAIEAWLKRSERSGRSSRARSRADADLPREPFARPAARPRGRGRARALDAWYRDMGGAWDDVARGARAVSRAHRAGWSARQAPD